MERERERGNADILGVVILLLVSARRTADGDGYISSNDLRRVVERMGEVFSDEQTLEMIHFKKGEGRSDSPKLNHGGYSSLLAAHRALQYHDWHPLLVPVPGAAQHSLLILSLCRPNSSPLRIEDCAAC